VHITVQVWQKRRIKRTTALDNTLNTKKRSSFSPHFSHTFSPV